ncbi:MAG: hypothetical protein WA705_00505 [Candidatus Ozemobacteraceae bacterium]
MLKMRDIANIFGVSQTVANKKPVENSKKKLKPSRRKSTVSSGSIHRSLKSSARKSPQLPVLPDVSARVEGVEKAIFLLVEEIRGLRQENTALRLRLEAPPIQPTPRKKEAPRRFTPKSLHPAAKREPIQRELSLWESIQLTMDDCMGLLFGKG